ncbi:corticotropin-releasing factor receptor 1-like isoform X2 [Gordionus sp. m RMFG-2023]|uniref:corticotropin-releasing factor receptor 1-like isoform X2 n=1 Tax=Gordionus sp. m RMFG-2023 TaxID=3053472 RepID=UPI0031FDC772
MGLWLAYLALRSSIALYSRIPWKTLTKNASATPPGQLTLTTLSVNSLLLIRSLRCDRNVIHCHLIIAFIMSDILWILLHLFHTNFSLFNVNSRMKVCSAISVFYTYFYLANFYWMLAEGIFMYQMVIIGFAHKIIPLRYIVSIGWGAPFLVICAWAFTDLKIHGNMCMLISKSRIYYIYTVPIFIVLILNFLIFARIVKVLVEKVHSNTGNINYLKSFKGFIFLIPHLGITYFITLYQPPNPIYRKIIMPFLISTQGFFVSLYCCFMNREVKLVFTAEVKNLANRRRSSGTTNSFVLLSSHSDITSSFPYLLKRFSVLSNALKRPSVQSEFGVFYDDSIVSIRNPSSLLMTNGTKDQETESLVEPSGETTIDSKIVAESEGQNCKEKYEKDFVTNPGMNSGKRIEKKTPKDCANDFSRRKRSSSLSLLGSHSSYENESFISHFALNS